jgi:hypothetical protein
MEAFLILILCAVVAGLLVKRGDGWVTLQAGKRSSTQSISSCCYQTISLGAATRRLAPKLRTLISFRVHILRS